MYNMGKGGQVIVSMYGVDGARRDNNFLVKPAIRGEMEVRVKILKNGKVAGEYYVT